MTSRFAMIPLAAALAAASAAHAAANPYTLSVAEAVTHYSNIFNTAGSTNNPIVSDTSYSTSLSASVDQPFGRQRFFANGSVSLNRFASRNYLNNTGTALTVGLDWSSIERLEGNVLISTSRSLSEFNPGGVVDATDKRNIETNVDAIAKFRLGVVTRLSLEGSLAHQQASYTIQAYEPREFKQEREELGVSYRFSGLLTARTGVSLGQTRYPKFERIVDANQTLLGYNSDSSTRRDLYIAATWLPTGVSTITGRLNFGRTSYNRATERNFSGVTGSAGWDWTPLGKLSFSTNLSRDTGQDNISTLVTAPSSSSSATFLTDTNRVTDSLRIGANYAATGKISGTAGISYSRREFVDTTQLVGGSVVQPAVNNRDHTTSLSLGVRWIPTRAIAVGCNVEHNSRSAVDVVSGSTSSTAPGFSANTIGCQASLTLN